MKCALFIFVVLSFCAWGVAGDLEEWIEASPYPEELQAWLDELRQNPLDLNRATEDEIAALPFWDSSSAKEVIKERVARGGFADLGEVIGISDLSSTERGALEAFACVKQDAFVTHMNTWMSAGCSDVLSGASASSFSGKGQATFRNASGQSGFVSVRRLASDPTLFDRTSVGLEMESHGNVPRVLVGDFQYEAGTGLVFASSYGMANWLSSPDSREPGDARGLTLKPSSDDRSVYRGMAMQAKLLAVNATLLASWNRMDAAIGDSGATHITEGETASPELSRARHDQTEERLLGASVQAGKDWWQAGLTGYKAHYSPTFIPIITSTSLPSFSGSSLSTGSLFFKVKKSRINAVAEWAGSQPGGHAFQGAISATDAHTGLTAYYVRADADFYSTHSKLWGGFGSAASNQSTAGMRFHARWHDNAIAIGLQSDVTPLRTATSPLSRHSSEIESRWVTTLTKPLDIELLVRRSRSDQTGLTQPTTTLRTDRGRIEVTWRSREEYRFRFEIRSSHLAGQSSQSLGTLLFVQTKARVAASDIFARLTVFGLEDDQTGTPLQIYEGTLAGIYPLVPLLGSGRRAAIMISHEWLGATASLQASHTVRRTSGQERSSLDLACGLSCRR